MKYFLTTGLIVTFLSTSAPAADPASVGEKTFKKCAACHAIISDSGEVLRKGGKSGPNLYGVIGRTAGRAKFRYSKALKTVGEAGLVWDEIELAAFVKNPTAYLTAQFGGKKARSKMAYKLKKGGSDVAAYLKAVAE